MSQTDLAELRRIVPDGVIRTAELRAAGVSNYAVSERCRPSGPWQRVLPGVVLMSTGPPTRRQRLRAAVAYAGPGCLVSGVDALRCNDIDLPCPAEVLVLLPAERRAVSRSYLTVERTTRLPGPVWRHGLPLAPVVRATVDAARREHDQDRLRALLLAPLEAGACAIAELLTELAAGSQRGTAAPRALLLELEGHQYSSGSFPSMSRTCARAQAGHNQSRPRPPVSTTQASASSGGSLARDRPHLAHRTSGSSATGGDATPYL
ncbi:MAG TPA: hypothetical protein VGF32_12875 [Streptosporangiaceae bacterium]|jgi:hypothetical protein